MLSNYGDYKGLWRLWRLRTGALGAYLHFSHTLWATKCRLLFTAERLPERLLDDITHNRNRNQTFEHSAHFVLLIYMYYVYYVCLALGFWDFGFPSVFQPAFLSHHLKLFWYLAQHLSVKRAVSQSVSQSIRQLFS